MHLTGFMNLAGKFQNTFGCGCFTGVNVREDADISVKIEVRHGSIPV
jgi:hypothetical protein